MLNEFREDIAGVVRAAGIPVKVMLELPLLTDVEKEAAVELAQESRRLVPEERQQAVRSRLPTPRV